MDEPRKIVTIDGQVVPSLNPGESSTWPAGRREWVDADDYEGLRQVADEVMDERDSLTVDVERLRAALEQIAAVRLKSTEDRIWADHPLAVFAAEALSESAARVLGVPPQ